MARPAAQTAVGPMVIVAVEQYTPASQRLIQDDLAYRFLPNGVKGIARLARYRPIRQLLFRATEKTAEGIWGSMLCRKRYVDDCIQATRNTIDTLVNLGAGLDTRAYRMASLSALPIFEVDLPENIALKRAKLQELYGEVPGSVCLVPIDFEHQDLAAVLAEHGYRADQRTFFVWEGVTQYLTEAGVRKTFDFLAKAASGSRLVFTYVRQDFIDGVNLYGAERAYRQFRVKQEVWHFGLVPERIGDFLAEYRWREVEQLGSQECVERYIRPAGRDLAVSELERLVYAERL